MKGHSLVVYDVYPASVNKLVEAGAQSAASPLQVAQQVRHQPMMAVHIYLFSFIVHSVQYVYLFQCLEDYFYWKIIDDILGRDSAKLLASARGSVSTVVPFYWPFLLLIISELSAYCN